MLTSTTFNHVRTVDLSAQFYQFLRFPAEPTVNGKAQEVRLVDSCIHDLVAEYSPFLSL